MCHLLPVARCLEKKKTTKNRVLEQILQLKALQRGAGADPRPCPVWGELGRCHVPDVPSSLSVTNPSPHGSVQPQRGFFWGKDQP